jgi:RNA-splicing ligase RtcB
VDTQEGQDYIKDLNFALNYVQENRRRIMEGFIAANHSVFVEAEFGDPVNIHHNYAALKFRCAAKIKRIRLKVHISA